MISPLHSLCCFIFRFLDLFRFPKINLLNYFRLLSPLPLPLTLSPSRPFFSFPPLSTPLSLSTSRSLPPPLSLFHCPRPAQEHEKIRTREAIENLQLI